MTTMLRTAILTSASLASPARSSRSSRRPPKGLPSAPAASAWATTRARGHRAVGRAQQAKTVQKADKKFGPEFTAEIRQLDKQDVKLYGFMMPLDQSAKQKRFLLSPFPPHCSFCMPGGPESMVEVIADKAFDFTYEPITVSGAHGGARRRHRVLPHHQRRPGEALSG